MNHPILEKLQLLLRAYWWRIVYGVLGVLLFFQLVSWAAMLLDFNRINRLIVQAEDVESSLKEEEVTQSPQPNPPREPAKNIFKKMEVKYQLTAILMDYAVINGQDVKLDGKIGKAVVTEIGNDYVMIQEEEKEQPTRLDMFKSNDGSGGRMSSPGNNRPNRPARNRSGNSPPRQASAQPETPSNRAAAPVGGVIMTDGMMMGMPPGMKQENIRAQIRAQRRSGR